MKYVHVWNCVTFFPIVTVITEKGWAEFFKLFGICKTLYTASGLLDVSLLNLDFIWHNLVI